MYQQKRQSDPKVEPMVAYLKPLNVIHPLYYDRIGKCPQCSSMDILWNCWIPTSHYSLHSVQEEETALGYQLICKPCRDRHSQVKGKEGSEEGKYCFATTNPVFWQRWQHWEIPREYFYIKVILG
jgi:hypothetical protein